MRSVRVQLLEYVDTEYLVGQDPLEAHVLALGLFELVGVGLHPVVTGYTGCVELTRMMRSIELLGTAVLPKLEGRGHRVDTTQRIAS